MKVLLLTLFVAFVASAPIEDSQDAVEVVVNGLPEGQPLEVGDIVDIKLKEHVEGQVAATSNLLHPFTAVGIAEVEAAAVVEPQPVQVDDVAENEVSPIQTLPAIVENDIAPEPVILPSPIAPEVVPEAIELPSPVAPVVIPEPVVLPQPVAPEVAPVPVVLPEPVAPEVAPEPVVLPEPVVPEVILPEPVVPEVVPSPEAVPEPVAPEAPEALPVPEAQLPNGEIFNDGNVQVLMNTPEDAGVIATLQSWLSMVMNYFNNGAQTSQQIL